MYKQKGDRPTTVQNNTTWPSKTCFEVNFNIIEIGHELNKIVTSALKFVLKMPKLISEPSQMFLNTFCPLGFAKQ